MFNQQKGHLLLAAMLKVVRVLKNPQGFPVLWGLMAHRQRWNTSKLNLEGIIF